MDSQDLRSGRNSDAWRLVAVAAMVMLQQAAHTETVKAQPLEIRLDLRSSSPPTGTVIIYNASASELRVWRTGNSWGDMTVFFEVKNGKETQKIIPKVKNYSVNAPFNITLPPGQDYKIEFNLGNGEWTPDLWRGHTSVKYGELTAIYYIPASPESDEYSVWSGMVRSAPVNLN